MAAARRSARRAADSGQRTVDSGQRTADSEMQGAEARLPFPRMRYLARPGAQCDVGADEQSKPVLSQHVCLRDTRRVS